MKSQLSAQAHRSVVLWLLTGIFACVGVIAYFLVADVPDYQAFSFAISLTATLLFGSAAVFYLRGLRYFRTNLRIAYSMLSVGIAMLGIAIAQLPFINLFNLTFWVDSGLMLLPYLVAVCLIFGGVRQFARSLRLKSKWFTFWLAGSAAIIAGLGAAILPHAPSILAEAERMGSVWLTMVIAVFFAFAARGILLIKRSVGVSYAHGLAWLFVAMVAASVSAAHYVGVLILSPGSGSYYDWSIAILPFNVAGWLFMKAGSAFNAINETVPAEHYPLPLRKFFGLSETVDDKEEIVSSINIIVYTMGMASDPAKADALVDDMRVITSRIDSEETLTPQDQTTLLRVYRRLEDYLVNDEPLRSFSRQQIRQNIERHFGLGDDATEGKPTVSFWPNVGRTMDSSIDK